MNNYLTKRITDKSESCLIIAKTVFNYYTTF